MISSNAAELRADLHRHIDRLDDKFISIVHAMVDAYLEQQEDDPIIGYSVDGIPMYASVAKREFKARLEAVDRGEFITLEELEKESETWLKGKAEDTK
jgi:orotate phosphoribosyltransferase-like protein